MTLEQLLLRVTAKNGTFKTRIVTDEDINFIDLNLGEGCKKLSVREKLYLLREGMFCPPRCKTCGDFASFANSNKGYLDYCSPKCSANSVEVKRKKKKTVLKRHGISISNLMKKGYSQYASDDARIKESNLKRKQTNLTKFGSLAPAGSKEIMQKIEETNLRKHGTKYAFHKEGSKHQTKEERILNLENYRNKMGVENVSQLDFVKKKRLQNIRRRFVENFTTRIGNNAIPLFDPEVEYTKVDAHYKWKCKTCEKVYDDDLINGSIPRCPVCDRRWFRSQAEKEVNQYIIDLGFETGVGVRSILSGKRELDIVVPERKVAIEYCGLYWHSHRRLQDKKYHQNKTAEAEENGYQLITIFEDQWLNKKSICKERIKHILGQGERTCSARQCKIREIDSKTYRNFLELHHIQGYANAEIKIGAFYNNELVGVMSFGSRKITRSKTYNEMLRFATKGSIPGLASKMFSHYVKSYDPTEVVSYADRCWSNGSLYQRLGFVESSKTKPNYWYTKDWMSREHRSKYMKHTLGNNDKTEEEIMLERGYDRFYDCGSIKYTWRKQC